MLIFAPLFFSGRIKELNLLFNALTAFIAFSLCASSVYILNDYKDRHEDRLHPKKKHRPIAAGDISTKSALLLMSVLAMLGGLLMAAVSISALYVLLAYIVINIGYSLHLKHVALVDVTLIAIGFVLRLFVGACATQTNLSAWIIIMTFLLALFLALAKRRDDVLIFQETGQKMRLVIDGYNLKLIDGLMMISAAVVIVAYMLYTVSPDIAPWIQSKYLCLTALFVILGIMRYLQIAFVENESGSPTKVLLRDTFLQITITAWMVTFAWIIYV
jgi:4-hydroxybenzoate polyprenyltransferase